VAADGCYRWRWVWGDVTDGDGYGVPDEHKKDFEIYLTADLLLPRCRFHSLDMEMLSARS